MLDIFTPFARYADFEGRARRREYWLFHIAVTAIGLFLMMKVAGNIEAAPPGDDRKYLLTDSAINYITVLIFWFVITIIPQIAVTVRRLHDADFTGWLYLLIFVPFGSLILLVLTLLDGTKGANRFGNDPKGRGNWADSNAYAFSNPEYHRAPDARPPAATTGGSGLGNGGSSLGFGRAATR